jgi:hypothetical protein
MGKHRSRDYSVARRQLNFSKYPIRFTIHVIIQNSFHFRLYYEERIEKQT